ncbi:hypothetical protein HF670_10235 [Acidithiobacillus thiooxidans]|uniref:hypothetical protein n=1 Tax=Acidithiobacillus thiooxidans TaxID=930 RepID=UPI001C06993D|nr:hypothetical protein [Acidithiobacillus thiooxidans]MBU2839937.1 hypothetical protein [Acidithiobacillus thiooxidans]
MDSLLPISKRNDTKIVGTGFSHYNIEWQFLGINKGAEGAFLLMLLYKMQLILRFKFGLLEHCLEIHKTMSVYALVVEAKGEKGREIY